ncbi:uncharacterized protein STAUR_5930 [Stigmatella aurantiaca DW4/3-1]|uniref:Uncharacterized protein n=1 Tax=Stigmatella aurantiaca (strain DW4/3-1) TaxID=378806 RepID=E3FZ56_STIAD|nr:uncharacterized protein STAUR_5930 [Stigmatella aurantiaca DW4/3-1]
MRVSLRKYCSQIACPGESPLVSAGPWRASGPRSVGPTPSSAGTGRWSSPAEPGWPPSGSAMPPSSRTPRTFAGPPGARDTRPLPSCIQRPKAGTSGHSTAPRARPCFPPGCVS